MIKYKYLFVSLLILCESSAVSNDWHFPCGEIANDLVYKDGFLSLLTVNKLCNGLNSESDSLSSEHYKFFSYAVDKQGEFSSRKKIASFDQDESDKEKDKNIGVLKNIYENKFGKKLVSGEIFEYGGDLFLTPYRFEYNEFYILVYDKSNSLSKIDIRFPIDIRVIYGIFVSHKFIYMLGASQETEENYLIQLNRATAKVSSYVRLSEISESGASIGFTVSSILKSGNSYVVSYSRKNHLRGLVCDIEVLRWTDSLSHIYKSVTEDDVDCSAPVQAEAVEGDIYIAYSVRVGDTNKVKVKKERIGKPMGSGF